MHKIQLALLSGLFVAVCFAFFPGPVFAHYFDCGSVFGVQIYPPYTATCAASCPDSNGNGIPMTEGNANCQGLSCNAIAGCVTGNSNGVCCLYLPQLTCAEATGGSCNRVGHGCPTDTLPASGSYDCEDLCCQPISCTRDLGGSCPGGIRCGGGQTFTYTDNAANNSCNTSICCINIQTCNGGASCSNVCVDPGGHPANTCGTRSTNYVCHDTTYTNCGNGFNCQPSSTCNQTTYNGGSCNYFYDNCSNNYACNNGDTCLTTIHVHAFIDYSHSGVQNSQPNFQGVTMDDNGYTQTTDANGNATDASGALQSGVTAFIQMTAPADGRVWQASPQTESLLLTNNNGGSTLTYNFVPVYKISGRVFNDTNHNQIYDPNCGNPDPSKCDSGYGGGTIHISGGPTAVADMTAAGDGTWATPTNLLSGTYTVSYASPLPTDYSFTTASTYQVTVGNPAGAPACNKGTNPDAACGGINSGSISNLDIGISNENTWNQSACLDVRDDSGSYTDLIPPAPSCGGVSGAYNSITNGDCTTGAGIIFTCDANGDWGLGGPNANNWQSGGSGNNTECFNGAGLDIVRTSYEYLQTTAEQSGITPIDMSQVSVCGAGGLSNCTLPDNLSKGIYLADGDLHLQAFTFPVDPANPQAFIFLIHGDLYIDGNILVPAGSVAAFSASGNIYVDKSVGNVVINANDAANNNPNIEGLYSADASFIVESYGSGTSVCNTDGTPLDKKLNIVGSIVTNAAKAGGSLVNNRDLCVYDLECSSLSLGDGTGTNSGLALSYLLTLYADGKFLSHNVFNWQELRP